MNNHTEQHERPRRARILIVDDHPLIADGLAELLDHEEDLSVCGHAANIAEALDRVEAEAPDLVIVDITLRRENGLELIRRLAEMPDAPRMLVVSMHDEDLYAQRALAAGAMGYVNKEQPVPQTLAAIRQVLEGRIYLSERAKERLVEAVAGVERRGSDALVALSDRELEIFSLMGQGMTTRAIADQLKVSPKTVETHRDRIKGKLGVSSLYELIRRAVAWSLDPGAGGGSVSA